MRLHRGATSARRDDDSQLKMAERSFAISWALLERVGLLPSAIPAQFELILQARPILGTTYNFALLATRG